MEIKNTKYFSWEEFDRSVEYISQKCKLLDLTGIYGIPRGGLCLAVALSHKLNVKLISKPLKNSLIVDDVYETGITLNAFSQIEGAMFFVLFSKKDPIWWNTVYLSNQDEWIVFPWENKKNIYNDQKQYLKGRISK